MFLYKGKKQIQINVDDNYILRNNAEDTKMINFKILATDKSKLNSQFDSFFFRLSCLYHSCF